MLKDRKAFTLIEVLAVIIIIGVLLLIAVPNYSENIASSRRNAYSDSIISYIESAKGLVYEKYYGSYPEDGELLLVPVLNIELEKNNKFKSPFGDLNLEKSYIIVLPRKTTGYEPVNVYDYYATFVDSASMGLINKIEELIASREIIKVGNINSIPSILDIKNYISNLTYEGVEYRFCIDRTNALLLCAV